jgi:hypothetical protein
MGTGTLEEALAWIEYCRDDRPRKVNRNSRGRLHKIPPEQERRARKQGKGIGNFYR